MIEVRHRTSMAVSRGINLIIFLLTILLDVPMALRIPHAIPLDPSWYISQDATTPDPHGGIKMGRINNLCDNAKWRLDLDWDTSKNYEYTCQEDESLRPLLKIAPVTQCIPKADIPQPLHKCMTEPIYYNDQPPRAGPHRPLWPVYGEYQYVPPQRWIHTLEHGGVVFLYHPCADPVQIKLLKELGRSCLRKHVITPYRKMPQYQSFGVITYGCRLLMGTVFPEVVIEYVKKYALRAPEGTERDGQYNLGLLYKAAIVSDIKDSGPLCPRPSSSFQMQVQNKIKLKTEAIDALEERLGKHVIM